MRRLAVVVVAAALLAGCGGSRRATSTTTAAKPVSVFADPPGKLALVDRGPVKANSPLKVHDISFAGLRGRIPGFLVLPPARKQKLPAVVLLHGSGGDRSQLLVTAAWIAARGAAALTITEPSSSTPTASGGPRAVLRQQGQLAVDDAVAARRAVDVLRSLPQVDPKRIGLLGWSAGARTGAVLAGAEPRLKAYVLMSAGALPVSEYAAVAPAELRPAVRRTLTPIDPLRWIARGRPGTIFLQDGRQDGVVPRRALTALAKAAPPGTRLRWYAAGHPLNIPAERDQLAWLSQKLGIRGPAVPGVKIGP